MHQQPRAATTILTRVVKNRARNAVRGFFNISVAKDNAGTFATKLERDPFNVGGGSSGNVPTNNCTAREGNLGDIGVIYERPTCDVS